MKTSQKSMKITEKQWKSMKINETGIAAAIAKFKSAIAGAQNLLKQAGLGGAIAQKPPRELA